MDKKELRKKYKKIRADIAQIDRQNAESVISDSVTSLEKFKEADTIFAFVSSGTEVSTKEIINRALATSKKVAVPLVIGKHEMCFIYISSLEELVEGAYGISEPVYNEAKLAVPSDKSVMLVPGLAYDLNMYRLGYGGGFYDCYLTKHPQTYTIGIGFSVQYTTEPLPIEPNDIKLNLFISEKGGLQ
jgi:5-formyltetrahydrofolate cyclo-ligase